MSGNYLLDTNIVIALFKKDKNVIKKVSESTTIFHPAVVIGELYYGAFHSTRMAENLQKIDQYRAQVAILNSDDDTARIYGRVKAKLKENGNPIPENDIWIAALAIQYELELISRDKHFQYIEGLNINQW